MIPSFSVKKAYTVIVGIVLVLILGIVAYMKMTVDLLPSMELPYIIVMTTYPGASPETVEMGVTKPIEQAVAVVDNVKNIQSVSGDNYSMILVEFTSDANMDTATIDMRESLDQVTGYFDDSVGNPIIMKLNPNMLPVMVAAVDMKDADIKELSEYVNDTLAPEIEGVNGVASVTSMGLVKDSVQVVIRQEKIDEVNKKIVKALDEKFSEAETAISDGEAQIKNGKAQIASGQNMANQKFAEAELTINNAKYNMMTTEKQVNDALSELVTKEKELTSTKESLETAIKSLNELLTSYNTMMETKVQLEAGLAANPDDAAMKAQLETINAAIATMESQLANTKDESGNPITFETLPAYIANLEGSLSKVNAGLTEIDTNKKLLSATLSRITGGKKTLDDSYIELKTQQAKTQSTLTESKAALNEGEKELESKKEEFQNGKDAAYENADMQNIITREMIGGILTAQNFDFPAGYITEDDVDYMVRVGEKFEDVDDISKLTLIDMGLSGLAPIKLSDVADVFIEDNSKDIYTRVNGNPGVVLSIAKQNEVATKKVADNLKDKFEELHEENDRISFTALMDQGLYIDLVSGSVLQNLFYGAILAVLILLFFLKDIRPTAIIAVSIPVSVIFAVVLMYFSHVTLNVISLSGLALGVGMLVDNSIVVIENIYRLRSEGVSVKDAAIKGASEMVGAITASTLTTVCVFLPIVFTSGLTRQLFTDMGLTIAYSLFASLVIAITFVPMMASKSFERITEKENKTINKISDLYTRVLPHFLNHKILVIIAALAIFVGVTALEMTKGFSFMPEMESPQMSMTLTMPEDTTSLDETAKVSDEVIDRVLEIDDIDTIGGLVGGGSYSMLGLGGDTDVTSVSYYIECKEDKKLTNKEIADLIMEKTKDLDCEIKVESSTMDMSALSASGIVVQVKGRELDKLEDLAKQVGEKIENVDGAYEVDNGLTDAVPEYKIVVDKAKAAGYGLTVAQVFQKISGELSEAKSSTTLSTVNKEYPVYVNNDDNENLTIKDINDMTIEGKKGEETVDVAISKIADVEDAFALSAINRDDQTRYISVSAKVKDGYTTTAVSNDVKKALSSIDLPAGYSIKYDGENESVMDALYQVMLMMLLAVVFMYLIMVAQFQSLKSPFIIMFTLPLAFTGGFAMLFITGNDISIIAMIGMVMLAGIIVNNGIVFVDTVNQLREQGLDVREAIVTTGKHRLRPITMTALTTILGLSTLAMGIGLGADMAQPMALVVIGGLIYGTLLTLVVIPCIYELFAGKRAKEYVEEYIE